MISSAEWDDLIRMFAYRHLIGLMRERLGLLIHETEAALFDLRLALDEYQRERETR